MALDDLIQAVVDFRDDRDWSQFHSLPNLAAALSVEAAELQELYLWHRDDNPATPEEERVADEIAEGDDIPAKRGPGVTQADLLVINKTDLAPYVDADLDLMERDSERVRGEEPTVFTNCKTEEGIDEVVELIERSVLFA
jgi:ethanolamine utilization protein EutP (predicted NTPase)